MVLFIAKEEIADRKFPLPTLLSYIHMVWHLLKAKRIFNFLGLEVLWTPNTQNKWELFDYGVEIHCTGIHTLILSSY